MNELGPANAGDNHLIIPRIHSDPARSSANEERAAVKATARARSHKIAYQSKIMQALTRQAISFARSNATVFVTGESGTGKELLARLIHENSRRAQYRFARVNCAAMSESLMESELFGHERGAFTGALTRRIGRFEWASEGTLLLDEISEIPYSVQAKLLRVLEEGEFQRVGSNENLQSEVRIIATSNQDLHEAVGDKLFRADLYHRLNVLRIHLPPLRERREDIPLLANHFFQQFKSENPEVLEGISSGAMKRLSSYEWPGNVRELRNVILRACIVAGTDRIEDHDLNPLENEPPRVQTPPWLLEYRLDEIERCVILANLDRFDGNKTHTANQLGITTRTLSNKLKLYESQGLLKAG